MNSILDRLDRMQKHDAFSDFRNNFATNVLGISQPTQDLISQGLNFGQSLLPSGGGIPNPTVQNSNQAEVVTTYPGVASQIFGPKVGGIPIVVLVAVAAVAVIMIRRK